MGVYHMQFDVWVWTFSKETKDQESSARTWQLKLLESMGLFLWAAAAGAASQREHWRDPVQSFLGLSEAAEAGWAWARERGGQAMTLLQQISRGSIQGDGSQRKEGVRRDRKK